MLNTLGQPSTQRSNAEEGPKVATSTSLWTVTPTGNWGADNKAGRLFADSLLKAGDPMKLHYVLREVVLAGRFDGTHVGFFHVIGDKAIKGAFAGF